MIIPSMRDVEVADLEQMGTIMPEGWYTATISEAEEGVSQNGKPFIQFMFTVANGPQQGRKIRDRVFFTREAMPIAKAKLTTIGYSTDQERQFQPGDFVGRGVSIKVEHEQGTNQQGLPRTWANVTVWKRVGDMQAPAAPTAGIDEDIPF